MIQNKSTIYIVVFIITALWDIILRFMSINYDKLPKFIQWLEFIKHLQPYFEHRTLLASALIAGFIGATALLIILFIHDLPHNLNSTVIFMIVVFIVSALYGFLIKWSRLFPYLDATYYKYLGPVKGMIHDGVSGLIVASTLLVIINLIY